MDDAREKPIIGIGTMGYGLATAWILSFMLFPESLLFSSGLPDGCSPWLLLDIYLLAMVASFVFFSSFGNNLGVKRVVAGLLIASIASCIVGLVVSRYTVFGVCFFGFSSCALELLWMPLLLGRSDFLRIKAFALVVTAFVCFLSAIFDGWLSSFVLVGAFLISVMILLGIYDELVSNKKLIASPVDRNKEDGKAISYFMGEYLGVIEESLVYGLSACFILYPQWNEASATWGLIPFSTTGFVSVYEIVTCATLLASGILLAIDFFASTIFKLSTLSKLTVLAAVPAVYILPECLGDIGVFLCGCLLLFISCRHLAFSASAAFGSCENGSHAVLKNVARYYAASVFGYSIPIFVLSALLALFDGDVTIRFLLFVAVYMIVLSATFGESLQRFFSPKGSFGFEDDGKNLFKQKLNKVVEEYGLTKRQAEVMSYLVKGRNAEFIAKEFFITHSTAKTHISTIYQKTGVHSQQDLMNLVESMNVKSKRK